MRRRYHRRRKQTEDNAALAWLFLGGLGFLWLVSRPSQPEDPPQPQYVGPPKEAIDKIAAAQEESMWCWAASIHTVLQYFNVTISQEQIVARIYGNALNAPASDAAISASLNGWAFDCHGRRVVIRSRIATGPPSLNVLMNEVARGRPILVTVNPAASRIGHAVVVTAATHIGRCVTSLVYRDPWPSPENCANAGRVEISGTAVTQFLSSIQSHWLISASFPRI
jgi:Papain-like cysteine protease AvrRpt2